MSNLLLNNYKTSRAGSSNPFPIEPELSSHRAGWEGIKISVEKQPPCETPQFTLDTHRVCIILDRALPLELMSNGKLEAGKVFPGGFALFEPNDYQVRWHQDIHFIQVDFEPAFLAEQAEAINGKSDYAFRPHFMVHDGLVHQLGLALAKELKRSPQNQAGQLYADSLNTTLVQHLLQNYSDTSQTQDIAGQISAKRLRHVMEYIHANLGENLGLLELSQVAGMSRYHFSRYFKATIGISPYEYVIQQRVAKAEQLLAEHKLSVSEVALACGFTHQSHLNRHFKRIHGITPGKFLKGA